jgi:hypothetical protein
VIDYAEIVRDKSILRSLIGVCEEVSEAAYTEQDDVPHLVEMAEQKIFAIAEGHENKNFIHRQSVLNAVRFTTAELTEIENEIRGATDKALAMELQLFDNMVTFAYRTRRNRIFFCVSRGFDTQLHQDKGFYLAKLVISHSNHHPDKFTKQHHIA